MVARQPKRRGVGIIAFLYLKYKLPEYVTEGF